MRVATRLRHMFTKRPKHIKPKLRNPSRPLITRRTRPHTRFIRRRRRRTTTTNTRNTPQPTSNTTRHLKSNIHNREPTRNDDLRENTHNFMRTPTTHNHSFTTRSPFPTRTRTRFRRNTRHTKPSRHNLPHHKTTFTRNTTNILNNHIILTHPANTHRQNRRDTHIRNLPRRRTNHRSTKRHTTTNPEQQHTRTNNHTNNNTP